MNLTKRYINEPTITINSVRHERALFETGKNKPLDIFKLKSMVIQEILGESAVNLEIKLIDKYNNEIIINYDDKLYGRRGISDKRVKRALSKVVRNRFGKRKKIVSYTHGFVSDYYDEMGKLPRLPFCD